jgi:hypothetical protein
MSQQLNTLPIEDFLAKARIAIKGNQKNITLTIKEVEDLQNSLSVVMTRLAGNLDKRQPNNETIEVKFNGGSF